MPFYLERRKRKNANVDTVYLYASEGHWDPVNKKQLKVQCFLGTSKNGHCEFHLNAQKFASVFSSTEFEQSYWNWRKTLDSEAGQKPVISYDDFLNCVDLNAGLDLLFSHVAKMMELPRLLSGAFGIDLADKILALSYYCARGARGPLYAAANWSLDQKLPGRHVFSEFDIAQVLQEIHASDILKFQTQWIQSCPKNDRLILDITSVSSYARAIPDVTWGYNRDKESLPQVNILMILSQSQQMPVWCEQLPGAITDITALKDTVKMMSECTGAPKRILLDRGFMSESNLKALLEEKIQFTVGVPLSKKSELRQEIKTAFEAGEFLTSKAQMQFREFNDYPISAITRIRQIGGYWVWDHIYYTDRLQALDKAALTKKLQDIEIALKLGNPLSSLLDQEIAEQCFDVKITPKRGIQVKMRTAAVAKLRETESGFFVLRTSQYKSAEDALVAYSMRDGIEKRFDDMKNQEDMKRLRVHSAHNMRSRIFIQFIAQILRCKILRTMKESREKVTRVKTVNDLIFAMDSLRYVEIGDTLKIYKRPTKQQREICKMFRIKTRGETWPSM